MALSSSLAGVKSRDEEKGQETIGRDGTGSQLSWLTVHQRQSPELKSNIGADERTKKGASHRSEPSKRRRHLSRDTKPRLPD